jgi:hypothetical protein
MKGYSNNELFVSKGCVYVLERVEAGFYVHGCWELTRLMAVYFEDGEIRMVFGQEVEEVVRQLVVRVHNKQKVI